MKLTPRLRRILRFQHTAFVVLFLAVIGLAGWLTNLYTLELDWTAGNRNTLAEASRNLLAEADGPITVTAYASDRESLRRGIRRLVNRYRRADAAEVRLEFINPNSHPQLVREKGIQRDGQLTVSYQGRTEKVAKRSEQAVTQAIQRVMQSGNRKVRFLTGHGERSPKQSGRQGLSRFARAMKDSGIQVKPLTLAKAGKVPEDTSLLVIADPTKALLEPEIEQIRQFIEGGGNLLWLADKEPSGGLGRVAGKLGVEFRKGTLVDPKARLLGMNDPTRVIVTSYPRHPITRNFGSVTVFPGSSGLKVGSANGWKPTAFLETGSRAWLETGKLEGKIRFQEKKGDEKGPVTIGVALKRSESGSGQAPAAPGPDKPPKESPDGSGKASAGSPKTNGKGTAEGQRLVVVTDSDFVSNAFLGAGANRDLALNMVHWLTSDEQFINVQPKAAPDTHLRLPRSAAWALPITFLGALPLLLFAAGALIWLRRRRL